MSSTYQQYSLGQFDPIEQPSISIQTQSTIKIYTKIQPLLPHNKTNHPPLSYKKTSEILPYEILNQLNIDEIIDYINTIECRQLLNSYDKPTPTPQTTFEPIIIGFNQPDTGESPDFLEKCQKQSIFKWMDTQQFRDQINPKPNQHELDLLTN